MHSFEIFLEICPVHSVIGKSERERESTQSVPIAYSSADLIATLNYVLRFCEFLVLQY